MAEIRAITISNVGKVRRNNEDAFLTGDAFPDTATLLASGTQSIHRPYRASLESTRCLAVFDGMGGTNAGEVASQMAAEALLAALDGIGPLPLEAAIERVQNYSVTANEAIHRRAQREAGMSGMGTTFVALLFRDDVAVSMNAGDSRAYLFRDGTLSRLSQDHSKVAQLVRAGRMTEAEARHSRERNQITRYFGMPPEFGRMTCHVSAPVTYGNGDRFLLCSDGLYDAVDESDLVGLLSIPTLSECAEALMRAALNAGAKDNVTLTLIDVSGLNALALSWRRLPKSRRRTVAAAGIAVIVLLVATGTYLAILAARGGPEPNPTPLPTSTSYPNPTPSTAVSISETAPTSTPSLPPASETPPPTVSPTIAPTSSPTVPPTATIPPVTKAPTPTVTMPAATATVAPPEATPTLSVTL